MRFGVCTGFEHVPILKRLGYDYIEGDLEAVSRFDASQLSETDALLRDNTLFMETANHFFPPEIRLCGDETDPKAIRDYTLRAFDHAVRLGLELAVLGSGPARQRPAGYDPLKAHTQLLEALRQIGDAARQYSVLVALEPLNREECNQMNTLTETLAFSKELNHPNICLLADLYHMEKEGEPFTILREAGGRLRHIHFNRPVKPRSFPARRDGYDYAPFACALRRSGYTGRVSVEARCAHFSADADASLSLMWELFQ